MSVQNHESARISSLASRLFRGGAPALIASSLSMLSPLLGLLFLTANDYTVWALASTLITIFLVLDFGAVALSVSLGARGEAYPATVLKICIIAAIPPLVLATVAMLIWPWYANLAEIEAGQRDAVLLFSLLGIGASLRSTSLVTAALALGKRKYMQRAVTLLSGATVQLIVVFVLLADGMGILALGFGVLAGGATQFVVGLAGVGKLLDPRGVLATNLDGVVWKFVRSKGAIALIGLSVVQLDRWALALAGSPEVLQTYDAVTRLATIPKVALVALLAGLIGEMSNGSASDSMIGVRKVYKQSVLITTVLSFAGGIAAFVACWAASIIDNQTELRIAICVLMAQTASALTLPATMYFASVRKPALELAYLVPTACLTYVGYYLGIQLQNSLLMIAVTMSSLFACSILYLAISWSYIGVKRVRRLH